MESAREQEIFGLILQNGPISISEIQQLISEKLSIPTLNRELAKLKSNKTIDVQGNGPSLKYIANLDNVITATINSELFFKKDVDERKIIEKYNPEIFNRLKNIKLFSKEELSLLRNLNSEFKKKIKLNSTVQRTKEYERLMIELSWKSSQIEGNTYDLLDTEQLLKHNIQSSSNSR